MAVVRLSFGPVSRRSSRFGIGNLPLKRLDIERESPESRNLSLKLVKFTRRRIGKTISSRLRWYVCVCFYKAEFIENPDPRNS